MILPLAIPATAVEPGDIVAQYCQLDFSGALLHSGADIPICKLALDNGEPPQSPVVLVESFKVASVSNEADGVRVDVSYKVLGAVDEEFKHFLRSTSPSLSNGTFHLKKERDSWKISLDSLRVSPHVGASALPNHIDSLIRPGEDFTRSGDEKIAGVGEKKEAMSLQRMRKQIVALQH
jgi:hypothetical protein